MPQGHSPRNRVGLVEGAAYVGVHTRTLRRWIAEGRLTAYRVGPRLIKVDLTELDRLQQPVGSGAA